MSPHCNNALILLFNIYATLISCVHSRPWQLASVLPTDLVGVQIGIWNHNLHLINGVYNATKLNYSEDRNDLVLWLTTDLSRSISITGTESASFSIDPRTSWDIVIASNTLGGFFCYSKCSAQINQYLFVISPEKIDNHDPTGLLIVYSLATKQLIGITQTPFYLNGGTCVVHNDTHLFSLGGYNTQCPTHKFDVRCDDPRNIYMYSTIQFQWITGALLPDATKVDSAACSVDKTKQNIYLFGGYNKHENVLSNKVSKYNIATDQFYASITTMQYARSEFSALLDPNKNLVYLMGGAIETVTNTAKLVEVYDINIDKFIDVTVDALSKSIRWYGSTVYAYNDTIDLFLVIGGHTGNYYSSNINHIKQNMTDYIQYLTINNNTDSFTDFPTYQPTTQPTWTPTFPSKHPTFVPTVDPTIEPSVDPTFKPTALPSWMPTIFPTHDPSKNPSSEPTITPTTLPTINPTVFPTNEPSLTPSKNPTTVPTFTPTEDPTADPSWSPFTAPPSSNDDENPYIIELDIELDCESESWISRIYPPSINQMVQALLTPKFERNPNIWVKTTYVTQTEEDAPCHIRIESIYSTSILSNAQQFNEYVNSTLISDLLTSFAETFDLTPNPDDIHITFHFIVTQTSDPTSFPMTTQVPEISDTVLIIVEDTDKPTVMVLNKESHDALEYWLFGQNNLNWIVLLVLCCLIFPCCVAGIWLCNRYQTQKLLRKHQKEIQKFTTLSTTLPSSPYRTQYKPHKLTNQSESSDDDDDGLPIHMTPGATYHQGTKYLNIPQSMSPDGYYGDRDKTNWNIPMHMNQFDMSALQRMQMMHGLNNIYRYNTYGSYPPFAHNLPTHAHGYGIPQTMDGTNTTDDNDIDGKTMDEPDGSTTTMNRSRGNTLTTVVSTNSNVVYNDSERMEYKDRENTYGEDMDDEIEARSTTTPKTQSLNTKTASDSHTNPKQYYSYSHAKRGEDYLMVKGMGITPSLVALDSGSTKEDLTISIRKRNASNTSTNSNVTGCDDYKTSAKLNEALVVDLDLNDNERKKQILNTDSSGFSPPYLSTKPKRNKGKLLKYRQTIALSELRAISPSPYDPNAPPPPRTPPPPPMAMSDCPTLPPESEEDGDGDKGCLEESEHDKQYEDMYADPIDGPHQTSSRTQRPRSGTDGSIGTNTINSEEEHTFILK